MIPIPPGSPLLCSPVLLAQTPPKPPKPTWCGAVAHGKAEQLVGLEGCAAGVALKDRGCEQWSSLVAIIKAEIKQVDIEMSFAYQSLIMTF